jgi:nicotinamide-nucleotide adenylyltransferase
MTDRRLTDAQRIADLLARLNTAEPPRLAFVRRAPAGIGRDPASLLCLSASFNPLTVAHAGLVREACRLLPIAEILLLLSTANVDKGSEGLPWERRLDLLLRYAGLRGNVSVAAVGHGRFVDKLEAIRGAYPADTRVIFLLGFDTLIRLFDPKYYDDRHASLATLFGGSEVVVASRGSGGPAAVDAFLARPDVAPFAHRIRSVLLPADLAAVSATEVRARLAGGDSIAALVPPEILSPLLDWRANRRTS